MLHKGDKDVNVAARQPEGGPAEAGSLSALSLPLISIPHLARMPDGPAKAISEVDAIDVHQVISDTKPF